MLCVSWASFCGSAVSAVHSIKHVIRCLRSKSARRKKREEAQKLPEVSKEIFYDVSGDLKAVFGATTGDVAGGTEETSWDQEEEEELRAQHEEQTPLSSVLLAASSSEKEESTGFKFSFFGDETEAESKQTGRLNLVFSSQSLSVRLFLFSH